MQGGVTLQRALNLNSMIMMMMNVDLCRPVSGSQETLVCGSHCCLMPVFVVVTAAQTGGDGSSSAERSSTSSGDYTAGTVVLAIALGASLAVLVTIFIVFVVQHFRASQPKSTVDDRQEPDVAATVAVRPTRVRGSLPSWGFDSIRSKYSVTSEASVDDQLS